ncbi:16S rRNA m(4)C1402 methyltransferase [Salinisphaera sp. PC39]|uniref:16S rRNA (cytosine(1402)-N(4))-methyltransferase RsmH n=1 Tax=Salinisphaera sp. PC39 TaxID=1304156 RepID=UPI00333F6681
MKQTEHKPVLLDAAMAGLAIRPDGVYVDATFGRGGHSAAILSCLGPGGRLLAFDKDPEAGDAARATLGDDPRFSFHRASFARLGEVLAEADLAGRVDGILMDLGVSSPQLDAARRGFSFSREGPLDMRMDPSAGESAAEWLAVAGHGEIARVLKRYGEEPLAGRIAGAIVDARERAPIETTARLAEIIASAVPARVAAGSRIHPATRSFQALRIHINRELEDLSEALAQCLPALAPGGRLVVISFHSLEDRIVKRFMRDAAHPEPPPLPMAEPTPPALRLIGKPHRAGADEIAENPRARSAILRVAERTAGEGT